MDSNTLREVTIHLGWTQIWIPVLLLAILQFLLARWIDHRLQHSIKNEYDKKLEALRHEHSKELEMMRFEIRVREQAAKVAELLSEARNGGGYLPREHAKNLNKLAWELSLWLPAETVRALTAHLCYAEGSKPMKEILIDVRKHILANPSDGLRAEEIVNFKSNVAPTF